MPANVSTMRPPLPLRLNDLVQPDKAPKYDELVARRRLGRTALPAKLEEIGKGGSLNPSAPGFFEYAHLRAPLPKDLAESEIFAPVPGQAQSPVPETYFLMRRSKDGCINASGMFKIAFPWAKIEDEKNERDYVKTLPGCSEEETAGNVWITPDLALSLAQDYHITLWIRALLDPAEIQQSSSLTANGPLITTPPHFALPPLKAIALEPPSLARNRSRRSTSPVKSYAMTPSKRRTAKAKEAKEQREASQQHLRELEASAAAAGLSNGVPATPATTKKRATSRAAKKAQNDAATEEKEAPQEAQLHKVEVLESVELKERVNGADKPATRRRAASRKAEEQPADSKSTPTKSDRSTEEHQPSKSPLTTDDEETGSSSRKLLEVNKQQKQALSSSQKENYTPFVFQTPRRLQDSDDLPYSLAEMETPSRAETESIMARARQMVSAAAAAITPERKTSTASPSSAAGAKAKAASQEAKEESDESSTADYESVSESIDSKKRKADILEAADKEADALTKDDEKTEGDVRTDADRRPAKRSKVTIAEEVRKERFRHRGVVGLLTAVGIAGIIPYFF